MSTGERLRGGVLILGCAVYVSAAPVLFGLAVRLNEMSFAYAAAIVIGIQILMLALTLVLALIAVVARRRRPLMEQMPAEAYASIVAVPIGTAAGTTVAGIAMSIERTGLGWVYFCMCVVMALFMTLGVPILAATRLTIERRGNELALYDDTVSAVKRIETAKRRWEYLASTRRRVLAVHRRRWLGEIDDPPLSAWPSEWNGRRWLKAAWLLAWAPAMAGAAVLVIALPLVHDLNRAPRAMALVAFPPAMATFTLVLQVYRVALEEQTEAQRLQERYRALREQLAERMEPDEPVPVRSRWRRAWEELRRP